MPGQGLGSGITGRSELKATGTPARISPRCGARSLRSLTGKKIVDATRPKRAGADQRAAKAGLHAKLGRRLEQLPREKFVDPDTEPAVACQAFISTQVVDESTVHGGADRCDSARDKQLLGLHDPLDAALQSG